MWVFLDRDISPAETRKRLRGSIGDTIAEVDFRTIVDCLWMFLTSKGGDDQPSPLARTRPTSPLMDRYLLRYFHNILIRHLQGWDPSTQRARGSLISTHIEEVTVESIQDREEKLGFHYKAENKGVPELLGTKLTT